MLWVLISKFSWKNKKNIKIFHLKNKLSLELCMRHKCKYYLYASIISYFSMKMMHCEISSGEAILK